MDEGLKNQTAMMDKTSSQTEGRERELNLFKTDPAGTDEQTSRTGGAANGEALQLDTGWKQPEDIKTGGNGE